MHLPLHLSASKLLPNVHQLQDSWELLALHVLLGWVREHLCLLVFGAPKIESQIVISQPLNVRYKFNKDFITFWLSLDLLPEFKMCNCWQRSSISAVHLLEYLGVFVYLIL